MYYGYVYLITNKINNKKYVGLRASPVFDETYWGSGILIKRAIEKYGKENFFREILHWCDTHTDLIKMEVYELQERKVAKSDEYYNIIDTETPILYGENNGFYGKNHSEKTKNEISIKNSGNTWSLERKEKYYLWSKSEDCIELKNRLSEMKKGNPLSEKHRKNIENSFTKERRQKISEEKKLFFQTDEGLIIKKQLSESAKERFTGIPKSEEHRKKISNATTGKKKPWVEKINKNPEKIRKTADKHLGMKRSDLAKAKMSLAKKGKPAFNKGKKYFYNPLNPEEKILCFQEEAPEGWVNGIYKK